MIDTIAQIIGYIIIGMGSLSMLAYVVGRLFEFMLKWTGYWPMFVKTMRMIIVEKHKQKNEARNAKKDM